MRSACDFPFGSQCYSQAAFAGIVSSEECAMQWAATVNVSLPSTFTMLAEVNQQAHAACSALTTKVRHRSMPPVPPQMRACMHAAP